MAGGLTKGAPAPAPAPGPLPQSPPARNVEVPGRARDGVT
jgi:hypothetical protein